MDSGVIVKEFRNRFGAIIANGQGSMKGQIFRIAHLGYFDFADLFAVVAGLEIILNANGYPVEFGNGRRRRRRKFTPRSRSRQGGERYEHPDRRAAGRRRASSCCKSQPGWNVIVSNPKEYPSSSPKPTR